MAQAVNYSLTPDEISKVKSSRMKTTSQAITETKEYDLEMRADEKPARALNNAERRLAKGLSRQEVIESTQRSIEEHRKIWLALAHS